MKSNNLVAFIDCHGHSIKPNAFMYGPHVETKGVEFWKSKFIPKMVAEGSDFFRFESSIFKIADSKRNTARVAKLTLLKNYF